jgi:hypothetical protein
MPDKNPSQLKVAARTNSRAICVEEGCMNKRNSAFGKRCVTCVKNIKLHGTAHAFRGTRSYKYKKYSKEIEMVTDLVGDNRHHPAISGGTKFIEMWMHKAVHAPETIGRLKNRIHGRHHMRILADNGVEPVEILINLCAAWLYVRLHQKEFDARHRVVQFLGGAVVRTRSWNERTDGRLKASQLTAIGNNAWHHLIKLFLHIEELFLVRAGEIKVLREAIETPIGFASSDDTSPRLGQATRSELLKECRARPELLKVLGINEEQLQQRLDLLNESTGE